jgi:hypothetical protein
MMGEAELNYDTNELIIKSHIISYGNAANDEITERIRSEIEIMWNEPKAEVEIHGEYYTLRFIITAELKKDIDVLEVYQNLDPKNNYFRIEAFVHGNISFVDGLGCNSGYFKLENLYEGSTTAAHEYGHTLGLDHPTETDIRGKGVPGIMYPRGTLVDPDFQYDPSKPAGVTGGTMHPMHRKVSLDEIKDLRLHKINFHNGKAILGAFTNIYHPDHASISAEEFMRPPIMG